MQSLIAMFMGPTWGPSAITSDNVDQDLWCHMASLDDSVNKKTHQKKDMIRNWSTSIENCSEALVMYKFAMCIKKDGKKLFELNIFIPGKS